MAFRKCKKRSRSSLANADRNFSPCDVCDVKGSLIGKSHAEAWKAQSNKI